LHVLLDNLCVIVHNINFMDLEELRSTIICTRFYSIVVALPHCNCNSRSFGLEVPCENKCRTFKYMYDHHVSAILHPTRDNLLLSSCKYARTPTLTKSKGNHPSLSSRKYSVECLWMSWVVFFIILAFSFIKDVVKMASMHLFSLDISKSAV
jgi:hypothetical protein